MTPEEEGSTRRAAGPTDTSNRRRVDLQVEELELLLKACKKYRATLPSYLQSVQAELALIDSIIRKLS